MRKFFRFLTALMGLGIGCGVVALIFCNVKFPGYPYVMLYTTDTTVITAVYVVGGFLSGLIFYIFSPKIIDGIHTFFSSIENKLTEMPALDILFCVLGTMIGMMLALLVSLLIRMISVPVLPVVLSTLAFLLFGYYGGHVGLTRRQELMEGIVNRRGRSALPTDCGTAHPKILDTSSIIDGRIYDVCKSGFLEGSIVVPTFVLKELRHIADHSDAMKRNRGRRGLDIVKALQDDFGDQVIVEEQDYPDVDEVDLKLLRLSQELNGMLVTNDYNLNKVAEVHQVRVLNINDLANALRPILLPGEELLLTIMKEGKEAGQGIGYLEDGTMVIVEGGKRHIGEQIALVVTSALQTSAGRMIFAKIR